MATRCHYHGSLRYHVHGEGFPEVSCLVHHGQGGKEGGGRSVQRRAMHQR